MSVVTTMIITMSVSEDVVSIKNNLAKFYSNGSNFHIDSVESDQLPRNWYGGEKLIEAIILIGAYNHLNIDAFIFFLRNSVSWESPECVQVILKEQLEYRFRIIDVFDDVD